MMRDFIIQTLIVAIFVLVGLIIIIGGTAILVRAIKILWETFS